MFGWPSVEDNVLAALDHRGGGGGLLADLVALPTRARVEVERRAHVEAVLGQCGLLDVRAEPAGTIPIGRARLVEFARAIAPRPDVLLLDEPTSGLETAEAATLGAGTTGYGRRAAASSSSSTTSRSCTGTAIGWWCSTSDR